MNGNPLLGQVLGGVFGQAMRQRGIGMGRMGGGMGGMGGALGGIALGSVLAGIMRGRGRAGVPAGVPGGGRPYANQTALLVMLLPLAMRWIQRNGGMNAVLDKFRHRGLARQTQSWVSTGENQAIDPHAVEDVVGREELRQMAQRLGVPEAQVAHAFAEIMPEMVDKLTPDGRVPPQADDVLDDGTRTLEREIEQAQRRELAPH